MASENPVGRVNYEPNSWPGDERGPREDPERGFESLATKEVGEKRRIRPGSFADHYSQARQFLDSQMPIERRHIAKSFIFELSKVERLDIRERMVANLRNVDEDFATEIADGLGLAKMPKKSKAAKAPITGLPPSPALSIVANGPESFAGRKVGMLVTDGADAAVVSALQDAIVAEGAVAEVIAPKIGGATLSDGTLLEAQQKIDGGPSVLYDAVAVLASDDGVKDLTVDPAAKDFVSDAFAHAKFVAYSPPAEALFTAAGVVPDDGFIAIAGPDDADRFVDACRQLRHWVREAL